MFNKKLKEKINSLTEENKHLERRLKKFMNPVCLDHEWEKLEQIEGNFVKTSFRDKRVTDHYYDSSEENIMVYNTTFWRCRCMKCGEERKVKILEYLPKQTID